MIQSSVNGNKYLQLSLVYSFKYNTLFKTKYCVLCLSTKKAKSRVSVLANHVLILMPFLLIESQEIWEYLKFIVFYSWRNMVQVMEKIASFNTFHLSAFNWLVTIKSYIKGKKIMLQGIRWHIANGSQKETCLGGSSSCRCVLKGLTSFSETSTLTIASNGDCTRWTTNLIESGNYCIFKCLFLV